MHVIVQISVTSACTFFLILDAMNIQVDTLFDSSGVVKNYELVVHCSDSLSDSMYQLLKGIAPEVVRYLSKPWYETPLTYLVSIGIPIVIFALGHYFEKLRSDNKVLVELSSYKSYSFNCIELLYVSCIAQSRFIKEYVEQFKKYDLPNKLSATSSSASMMVNRIDFSKLYSACVEHSKLPDNNATFKKFQDQLSIACDVLQEVVPTHQYFSSKYLELQKLTFEYIKGINSIGTTYRGITNAHPFYQDVCQAIVDNNYTSKPALPTEEINYYIQYDKIEKLCKEVISVCDKYGQDYAVQPFRIQVENLSGNFQSHILNVKSLFKQYDGVFQMYAERLELVAAEIKRFAVILGEDKIIRRKMFGFIGKNELPSITLDFN